MKSSILCSFVTILIILIISNSPTKAQGWEELASIDNPNPFCVMAASGGKIYLLSGTQGGPSKTMEYDPATNEWTEKSPIPQGCIYGTAVEVDGKIYVMGGGQSN
ncbi:hypothetical protein ACFLSQ_11965, partial [Bacteroidota bacterium]